MTQEMRKRFPMARKRRRPDMNKLTLCKCGFVNNETGEVCGKNVPMMKNARLELLRNITSALPIEDSLKEDIEWFVSPKRLKRDRPPSGVKVLIDEIRKRSVGEDVCKQIWTILHERLDGRTQFCREHLSLQ